AGKSPEISFHKEGEISKNPLVDRIIPSKKNDLFVILKNGMTVLIRESHSSKVVSCQVLVKTGSIYEGQKTGAGLSHYLEHVVSGGTTSTYTESEIKKRVQALGGATNAYTSYERTAYFINTTGEHFNEAINLLLSYVTDCQFNKTEYQREKPVILQEFQLGENNPGRQLWSLFMKTAYLKHPVRFPVIGERDIFLKMDRDDLINHYRQWYTPENLIVTIAGDIDRVKALKEIISVAGEIKRSENLSYVLPEEPRQLSYRHVEKSLSIARLTRVEMGFRTIKLTDPDLYALDVLAIVMGDGRTSRLYQEIRDKKGLALSIHAGSWTPTFVKGQFFINMSLSHENLSDAIEAIWEELSDVKNNLISKESLQRAKNKVIADYVFSQESAQSQARQLATDWAATGDPYFGESYVSRIKEVNDEDIRKVARKYFKKDALTLAVIKPDQAVSNNQKTFAEPSTCRTKTKEVMLPNQMKLLIKKNNAAPIVSFNFIAKGGLRYEPSKKEGLSRFMASLLTKGTKNRSKFEIARALEDIGGSISSSSGHNTVSVSVSVLKEHFDTALDVLADVILNPSFPDPEIEKQRKDTILSIKRIDEEWTHEVTRIFKRHYYRNHPYENDTIGTAESVQGLTREDCSNFYKSIIMPSNSVLGIFGDIDPVNVAEKVKEAFNDFRPSTLQKPSIEQEIHNIHNDEQFEVINEKSSCAVFVGFNGMTITDKDVPVVNVLDAIISGIGYPSGWLHDGLRGGEKSLVYYVHAYPAFGVDGGYFGVIAQTTIENYDKVLKTILEKIGLIKSKEVDIQTLNRAKNMCITMNELGLQTIAAQGSNAALNEIIGLGSNYDSVYPSLIKKVTADDVLRVAKKLFSHHLITATKPSDKDKK
ncbi:MAG: pitrilysin family protein, partial [Thermodesulfobacteriota bacterium]|nr:pitrilysin family protein [Thermodesulfobacteriota bacterium]